MEIRQLQKSVKTGLRILCENILLLLFTSVVILYFVESIYFQSFSKALRFLFLNDEPKVILLNWCIGLLFELTLSFFLHNMGACFGVTSAVAILLVIVNELKMSARGEAFTLNDISVAKEALQVAGNYELKLSGLDWQVILLAVVLVVILVLFQHPGREKVIGGKKGLLVRIVAGLLCAAMGVGLCGNIKEIMASLKKGGEYVYITSQYYDQNGFPVGLVRMASNNIQAPEGYSRQAVETIGNRIEVREDIAENPNVIFVMNESLYDISALKGVELNKDPLERLWDMQKEYTSGHFVSPAYGGGTCNVEFEVLTGCPMDEIGMNTLPYSEVLHSEIDSLASLLNERGYYTVAMHPNTGTYFNRKNVYKYMGFQESFFTEEMGTLPLDGQYAGDRELYDKLINLYEEKEQENIPFFAYVITMQNHGGYDYDYTGDGIAVLEGGSCSNEQALQTYCNLAGSSMEAFRYLVDYFKEVDRPTVIVMFGDHSPNALGSFGYSDELLTGMEQLVLYRTTPLVVCSNYGLPREEWGYVNGYSLASKVLNYCGIGMDSFWTGSLDEANVPRLGGYYYVDGEWAAEGEVSSLYIEYRQERWLMAYDRIFGRNYYGKSR